MTSARPGTVTLRVNGWVVNRLRPLKSANLLMGNSQEKRFLVSGTSTLAVGKIRKTSHGNFVTYIGTY